MNRPPDDNEVREFLDATNACQDGVAEMLCTLAERQAQLQASLDALTTLVREQGAQLRALEARERTNRDAA